MSQPNTNALFERSITLPDSDARDRLARLVGMEDKIKRLTNILSVLINPHGLQKWQKDHHHRVPYPWPTSTCWPPRRRARRRP